MKGFTLALQETRNIHDSINIPKFEYITLINRANLTVFTLFSRNHLLPKIKHQFLAFVLIHLKCVISLGLTCLSIIMNWPASITYEMFSSN